MKEPVIRGPMGKTTTLSNTRSIRKERRVRSTNSTLEQMRDQR
jgi:hypothetical protein